MHPRSHSAEERPRVNPGDVGDKVFEKQSKKRNPKSEFVSVSSCEGMIRPEKPSDIAYLLIYKKKIVYRIPIIMDISRIDECTLESWNSKNWASDYCVIMQNDGAAKMQRSLIHLFAYCDWFKVVSTSSLPERVKTDVSSATSSTYTSVSAPKHPLPLNSTEEAIVPSKKAHTRQHSMPSLNMNDGLNNIATRAVWKPLKAPQYSVGNSVTESDLSFPHSNRIRAVAATDNVKQICLPKNKRPNQTKSRPTLMEHRLDSKPRSTGDVHRLPQPQNHLDTTDGPQQPKLIRCANEISPRAVLTVSTPNRFEKRSRPLNQPIISEEPAFHSSLLKTSIDPQTSGVKISRIAPGFKCTTLTASNSLSLPMQNHLASNSHCMILNRSHSQNNTNFTFLPQQNVIESVQDTPIDLSNTGLDRLCSETLLKEKSLSSLVCDTGRELKDTTNKHCQGPSPNVHHSQNGIINSKKTPNHSNLRYDCSPTQCSLCNFECEEEWQLRNHFLSCEHVCKRLERIGGSEDLQKRIQVKDVNPATLVDEFTGKLSLDIVSRLI